MSLEPIPEMMRHARSHHYAVGYFESWSIDSLYGVIDADEVDCVVPDEETTEDYLSQLADRGTEYLIAPMKAGNANVA